MIRFDDILINFDEDVISLKEKSKLTKKYLVMFDFDKKELCAIEANVVHTWIDRYGSSFRSTGGYVIMCRLDSGLRIPLNYLSNTNNIEEDDLKNYYGTIKRSNLTYGQEHVFFSNYLIYYSSTGKRMIEKPKEERYENY